MAPRVHTCIGIAGSGKTHFGMQLLEQKLREGLSWRQVAYTSYSRAACREAARRAASITGESAEYLQKNGSYATIHALTLRAIGVDKKSILDSESSEGRKFISEACGMAPEPRERGTLGERIATALSLWDLHRATLGHSQSTRRSLPDVNSGIVRDDRPNSLTHTGIVDVSPDLQTQCQLMMTGTARPNIPSDARFYPAFHMGSEAVSSLDIHVCEFDNSKAIPRALSEIQKHDSVWHDNKSVSPLYVDMEIGGRQANGLVRQIPASNACYFNNNMQDTYLRKSGCQLLFDPDHEYVIKAYENAKRMFGRIDFTDILMMFLGITCDSELKFIETGLKPQVTGDICCFVADEYQDCSPLLACAAERLSEDAQELHLLGDDRQAIFLFAGSSGAILRAYDEAAIKNGTRTLLNTSRRNPIEVIEWGERILSEDPSYVSRCPSSEAWEDGEEGVFTEGSVGLVKLEDFLGYVPEFAQSDVLILSRAWFSLLPVKERLDSLGVPWRSCQEKQSSRWECPAKIAYTLAMRDLEAGNAISEVDWRRITDTLPQRLERVELFVRGTKAKWAKWAKIACSHSPTIRLEKVLECGATQEFVEFVTQGKWRREMFALLDAAIERFGIDIVRNPKIRLGSVHSVKGLEARNVFCLSASTERCSGAEADVDEEICLKYVAITRASKNYRLVVNVNDIARSKPQFWAAPKGFWEFDKEPPKEHYAEPKRQTEDQEAVRSEDSGFDSQVDDFEFRL